MADCNRNRVQDELDSLRVIYSDEDQLNFHNSIPLRDETVRFSLQLKSSGGQDFKLRYELPVAYPNQAKPTDYIELKSTVIKKNCQAQLQKELSNFITTQSLDEELLISIVNFCETKLAFDNKSTKATEILNLRVGQ